MTRDWRLYIEDILEAITRIEEYTTGFSSKQFEKDRKTQDAVVRNFEIMGEAAKNVPLEIRKKYPAIPWREMAGLRDKLTHAYFGVKIDVVWKTSKERLPELKKLLKSFQKEM